MICGTEKEIFLVHRGMHDYRKNNKNFGYFPIFDDSHDLYPQKKTKILEPRALSGVKVVQFTTTGHVSWAKERKIGRAKWLLTDESLLNDKNFLPLGEQTDRSIRNLPSKSHTVPTRNCPSMWFDILRRNLPTSPTTSISPPGPGEIKFIDVAPLDSNSINVLSERASSTLALGHADVSAKRA